MRTHYPNSLRLRKHSCFFCSTDNIEQGYSNDFYIRVSNQTDQLTHSQVLTTCKCIFTTHTSCWDYYCESPIYLGCPICNSDIASVDKKRLKGVAYYFNWKHTKHFWYTIIRLLSLFFIIFYICIYFGLLKERKNVLRDSQETP